MELTTELLDEQPIDKAKWPQLQEWDRWSTVRRLPNALRLMMEAEAGKVFIGGGYIRSCVSGEPVNDIDVFTTSAAESERLSKEISADVHKAPNSYTLILDGTHIQFIHRWGFTDPRVCIESFDFTVAKAIIWYSLTDRKWMTMCEPRFYGDLAAKRLVYTCPQRNEDAGGSLLRVLKFYQRGYRIPLDSLGAVVARIVQGIKPNQCNITDEKAVAKILTGLLREVDPAIDPFANAHIDTITKL